MSDAPPPPLPPPPPSPPIESRRPTSRLAWVGSVALLALVTIPQFFMPNDGGDNSVPYRIGTVIGAAVFGILIAKFIWWLTRRSRRDLPKWSPWVFVIAAGVATLSLFSSVAQRAADITSTPESAQETEAPYAGPASSYFVEPEGYRYRELTPDLKDEMEKQITSNAEAAAEISEFDGRLVLQRGKPVGATIVVLIEFPPERWDEAQQGFVDGFEKAGGVTLESTTVAGVEALTTDLPQGVVYVLLDRNLAIQVMGFSDENARDIVEGQVPALAD